MNTLLLRTLELKKTPSLQTFAQYREAESQNCRHSSVTSEGELLEHQTLELRVHPPNVSGCTDSCSANLEPCSSKCYLASSWPSCLTASRRSVSLCSSLAPLQLSTSCLAMDSLCIM